MGRNLLGRRRVAVLIAALACQAGCGARTEDLGGSIDRSLARALRALIAAQSPDGAWRSRTYGGLKDGLALTPPVLKALTFGPSVPGAESAKRKGAAYLAERVRADGSIDDGPDGLIYPVYTASTAAIVLGRVEVPGGRHARDSWLRELRARQLTEALGRVRSDPGHGGWGDSPRPTTDADLSSTLFAVGALRIAGDPADEPAIRKALAFVERCQNFAGEGNDFDASFDDGGFFFTPTNPVRNKAGVAGTDRLGRERYHSYGGATADGLRALLRCGLPPENPRVVAARRWLERRFSALTNPGDFEPAREVERDATYYYECWSLAHAFRALGVREIDVGGRKLSWAEPLTQELIRRQRPDGTWVNRFSASKEDDPLIATTLAAGALGIGRSFLAR